MITELDLPIKPTSDYQTNFSMTAARAHIPLSGTFELTARCSLRCKMCYVRLEQQQLHAIGRELTAKEWLSLAKDAVKAGTLYLMLTGGEPLLREDFEEIYTALCQMGFIITLNTNATLMTPELAKLFKKYPPSSTLVTLYGASPDTYEKVCGTADGFEKTIRGLELLSETPTQLLIRTTFIRDNMHELHELIELAHRFGSYLLKSTSIYKPVRGAVSDAEKCRLTHSQAKEINEAHREFYEKFLGNKSSDYIFKDDNAAEVLASLPPVILPCAAGKLEYCISWDGNMLPCLMFSHPYSLPLEEGFLTAWNRLPSLLDNLAEPAACAGCKLKPGCDKCPAKFQAETGCFDKRPDYICQNKW